MCAAVPKRGTTRSFVLPEVVLAAEKIIVASSKGGVGKTTVALGIAGALCHIGKKVLLLDLDFENRCLDLYMGIENASLFNIADVARGVVPPEKAMIRNSSGLSFVAAPDNCVVTDDEGERRGISTRSLAEALRATVSVSDADYVIFDTGTSREIPRLLAATFPGASAIVVASHQAASTRGAERTAADLDAAGIRQTRLVICGYEFRAASSGKRAGILDIIDSSKVRLIGAVPYDRALMLSHENGVRVPAGSPADIAFRNIAERITGRHVRLFDGIGSLNRKKIL